MLACPHNKTRRCETTAGHLAAIMSIPLDPSNSASLGEAGYRLANGQAGLSLLDYSVIDNAVRVACLKNASSEISCSNGT